MRAPDGVENAARKRLTDEAMTWLRTPYAHMQRLKGVACDCAGLPLEVYAACGVIPKTDVGRYSSQWHLHRSEELYLGWVERFGRGVAAQEARAGDFLLFRFGRTFSHGAILIEGQTIIHAYARARMVTLDDLDANQHLSGRERLAFTFWDR